MPRLPEAIRTSGDETASYWIDGGDTVIVQRVTGDPDGSDTQESYAVSLQRAGQPSQPRFVALDLEAALERLGELGLPGFDPMSAAWQPA